MDDQRDEFGDYDYADFLQCVNCNQYYWEHIEITLPNSAPNYFGSDKVLAVLCPTSVWKYPTE